MMPDEVKILHCADLHLGSDFRTLGDKGELRRLEVFRSFERIIALCRSESVDFLLIAGDFFDRIHVGEMIINEVISLIASVPDTIVAITPGNHDPYSVDSCYHLRSWPGNTVIFCGAMSFVNFKDKGVCLWGCGFGGTYASSLWQTDSGIRSVDGSLINIGVMHGDLSSESPQSPYNPIPSDFIAGSGLDYLALGHIHRRSPVSRIGKTFFSYSGPPDGRGFDETGALGIYIGLVGRGYHRLQFHKISSREFLEVKIGIGDFTSNAALAERIASEMKQRYPDSFDKNIYKVILTGQIPQPAAIDICGIEEKLSQEFFFIKVENGTCIAADYQTIAAEDSLKGIFVRKMLAKMEETGGNASDGIIRKGLQYGLSAFEGEVKIDDYNQDRD
ncbi:MAG: metallophosphoesterase family protein [Saccharofermentanales bacterium]